MLSTTSHRKKTVLETLASCTRGKIVLKSFEKNKIIDSRTISEVIIENEFDYTGNYRISNETFLDLSSQLGEIFQKPSQSSEDCAKLFYQPYLKRTKESGQLRASGVLYEKYCNFRLKLRKCGILVRDNSNVTNDSSDIIVKVENVIDWTRENSDTAEEVIRVWDATFDNRPPCTNVLQYFQEFKCLDSEYGYIMLVNDYNRTHTNEVNLIAEWNIAAPKLLHIAKTKKRLLPFDEDLILAGKSNVAALFCLPRILGIILRKRKNGGTFGTTVRDVQESLIVHVHNHEELLEYKANRTKFESADKVGPYIAVVGDLLNVNNSQEQPLEVFVIVNNVNYNIKSRDIIEALDVCYKIFFSLNMGFTPECRHVWLFIQVYICKNKEVKSKLYTVVSRLVDEISNIQ